MNVTKPSLTRKIPPATTHVSQASVDTYVATEEEADDPELLEERKVASFVHAVADLRRVGIPLTPQDLTRDKPLKRSVRALMTSV